MPAPLADWASSSHLAGQWTELLAFFSFTDFRHFLPYGSLPARLSLPSSLTLSPLCFKKKQKHPDTVQESEKGVSEACFWSTLFLLVSAEESVWTVTRTGLWLPETWSGGADLWQSLALQASHPPFLWLGRRSTSLPCREESLVLRISFVLWILASSVVFTSLFCLFNATCI